MPRSPLNEGRGINPGDTSSSSPPFWILPDAQRRPGHQPRRHLRARPARRPCSARTLNEGRGINPGDTGRCSPRPARGWPRSTKAGASTPATQVRPPRRRREVGSLNEGRGINPGDTARFCKNDGTETNHRSSMGVGASTTTRLRLLHVISDDTRQNGQHQAVETALTAPGTRGFRESLRVRR